MSNAAPQIRFDDGAGYERGMGIWSRTVGEMVLDWAQVRPGLAWLDVGCGNGAFTELIVERCDPEAVEAVDPSPAQLAFARTRPNAGRVRYREGDAMALPLGDGSVDVVSMALVIFFVPEPARGVAEMVRVARPGGRVLAYAWDIEGGGFPFQSIWAALEDCGLRATLPPNADAAREDRLRELWSGAGLEAITQLGFTAQRRFADAEEFWTVASLFSSSTKSVIAQASPALRERVREAVRAHLPAPGPDGSVTVTARANAIIGTKPG